MVSECVKRIKPLNPRIAFSHEYEFSDYPDIIKIPMEDGRIVAYVRQIELPAPRVIESYELLRMIENNTYGGYKPRHMKNDR